MNKDRNGKYLHRGSFQVLQNPYEELDFSAVISNNNYSSKKGDHKGIGLKKVAKLVSETDGIIILNNEDGIFTVKIIYNE